MSRYLAVTKTWLSHESRMVEAGQEFETVFPLPKGVKELKLGDNLKLLPAKAKAAPDKPAEDPPIA
jgi:hypothetical protein